MSNQEVLQKFNDYLVSYSFDNISMLPERTKKSLESIKPNKLFIYNNKPLILYFKTTQNLNINDILKKYWNFSEAPIIFVESDTDIEVYNGFDFVLKNNKPSPIKLDTSNLSYYSLISGEYFKSQNFKSAKNRLDKVLLQNIKDARELLIQKLTTEHKEHIANSLIGRVIFIRYLIDRKIALFYNEKKQIITNDNLKEILSNKDKTYRFFKDLQSYEKGFNGDWFPIEHNEENIVKQEHLNILRELISGTEIKTGQRSLFDFYDFSIIPIEFISNVYEHFIGKEKQKKDGAYYTPTFLVDYVLKYTVDEYFKNNPSQYNCKVLDPSCGSGIFLVETFRKLVAQYEKVTGKKANQEILKQLVKENIFGIDLNKEALQISIFSLYLAMLDYQEPKDIENFKFPYLMSDNPNFFNNDFFDTTAPFNEILKEKQIDFIIGNPPYGRGTIKKNSFADNYIKTYKLSIGDKNIVQPFMLRVKDLINKNTQVSFIVTSKIFYNLNSKKFREYFLNNFKVNHILELSSVRKQIFENADTPVSIIFYTHSNKEDINKNIIKYISMKPNPYFEKLKILLLSKSDFKKVSQTKLLEYDYLWKILVYGSYLDFNFIKRLHNIKKVNELIDSRQLLKYQGFKRKDGNKKIEVAGLKNFLFIDTGSSKKDLKPFYISKTLNKFSYDFVGYIKKEKGKIATNLYEPPILLFTGGLNKYLKQLSAICYKKAIFTSSVVALKPTEKDNLSMLKNLNGLFYSKFFSYFLLFTASSTGVRQEECDDYEKLNIPYIESKKIGETVTKIENLQKNHFDTNSLDIFDYEKKYKALLKELDKVVLEAFNLTKQEYALVDYATNIVIPWVIQKNYDVSFAHYDFNDSRINKYVSIFVKHYNRLYEQSELHFQATIYWSRYAIAIYFKTLKDKPAHQIEWKKEDNLDNFLKLMRGKTLENLFIQQDIKGFEQNGFYVLKPNEIKNWHQAIGYLDFYEFKDAILKAGKEKWKSLKA